MNWKLKITRGERDDLSRHSCCGNLKTIDVLTRANARADSPSRQRQKRVYSLVMHKDTFNADFYVVAATIIPVLYLALTLQGQTFEQILSLYQAAWKSNPPRGWRRWQTASLVAVLPLGGMAILATGVVGELQAIGALYQRQADSDTEGFVLITLFVLLTSVLIAPGARFYQVIRRVRLDIESEESPE